VPVNAIAHTEIRHAYLAANITVEIHVCISHCNIHTFVHSWWRPLASTNTNCDSTIRRRLLYTLFRQSEAAHNRYENDITDFN